MKYYTDGQIKQILKNNLSELLYCMTSFPITGSQTNFGRTVKPELWSRRCGARAQRAAEPAVRNAKCGT